MVDNRNFVQNGVTKAFYRGLPSGGLDRPFHGDPLPMGVQTNEAPSPANVKDLGETSVILACTAGYLLIRGGYAFVAVALGNTASSGSLAVSGLASAAGALLLFSTKGRAVATAALMLLTVRNAIGVFTAPDYGIAIREVVVVVALAFFIRRLVNDQSLALLAMPLSLRMKQIRFADLFTAKSIFATAFLFWSAANAAVNAASQFL